MKQELYRNVESVFTAEIVKLPWATDDSRSRLRDLVRSPAPTPAQILAVLEIAASPAPEGSHA
jgi:hypothetical protein